MANIGKFHQKHTLQKQKKKMREATSLRVFVPATFCPSDILSMRPIIVMRPNVLRHYVLLLNHNTLRAVLSFTNHSYYIRVTFL
jgi:hypothetical protein